MRNNEASVSVPSFDSLTTLEEMQIVERRREAFLQALARDPEARYEEYLAGVSGPARQVLLCDLVREEFEHRQELHSRSVARELQGRQPEDRALVSRVLAQRTATESHSPQPAGWGESVHVRGYDILEVLSDRGSAAVVYLAYDRRVPREVALKVLRPEQWKADGGVERFWREARLLAELQGAGVPFLFAKGYADGGAPYIAMELVRGTPLRSRMPSPEKPFHFDPACVRLLHAVAVALIPAHKHHPKAVVHLDLSPENVFVTPEDRIVILDWGLSRDRAAPDERRVEGTPDFMAPEKARGEVALYSPQSDVFSLGCFLLWALTGQRLFPGAKSAEEKIALAAANQFSEATSRTWRAVTAHGIPKDLAELTVKCLDPVKGERPADAGAVAERLAANFRSAAAEEQRQRDHRIHRRTFWRISGGAAAVLGAGAIGGLGFVRHYSHAATEARFAERVAAGNTAAAAGRWQEARLVWQPLLGDRGFDEARHLELRLQILRAAQFLNDRPTARHELDALNDHPRAGAVRGRLHFERAVYTMNLAMEHAFSDLTHLGADTNPYETEVLDLLRRVTDDPSVPEADRLTARGMLAPTAEKAIGFYKDALDRQPFHPYAGPYFLVTCLLAGRLSEALARADAWAEATPEDPLPWFYKAFILTLQGRNREADATLLRLGRAGGGGRLLPLSTVRACEGVVKAARVINSWLPEVRARDGVTKMIAQLGFFFDLLKVQSAYSAAAPGLFPVPLTPLQRRAAGRLLYACSLLTHPQAALSELAAVEHFVAPGTVEFVRGNLLMDSGRASEGARAIRRSAESSLHWWDVRAICWLTLAEHDLQQSKRPENAAASVTFREEVKGHLRKAALRPELPVGVRTKIRSLAEKLNEPGFRAEIERSLSVN